MSYDPQTKAHYINFQTRKHNIMLNLIPQGRQLQHTNGAGVTSWIEDDQLPTMKHCLKEATELPQLITKAEIIRALLVINPEATNFKNKTKTHLGVRLTNELLNIWMPTVEAKGNTE